MPRRNKKRKHSGHHGMHNPRDGKTEEDRDILKGKPFPRTSKPTHTNDESDPNRNMPHQG